MKSGPLELTMKDGVVSSADRLHRRICVLLFLVILDGLTIIPHSNWIALHCLSFSVNYFSYRRGFLSVVLNIKMNKFNAERVEMPVTVTTRVEDELAKVIDEVAKREGMDRSTVIRRFLLKAVKDWLIERSLEDYEQGKVTLWEAARRCDLSLWEIINEVKKREIHVPYTLEELKGDLKGS